VNMLDLSRWQFGHTTVYRFLFVRRRANSAVSLLAGLAPRASRLRGRTSAALRPLDPRLLRHAGRPRAAIGGLAGVAAVTGALTVIQAWLLATVIAPVFARRPEVLLVPLAALAAVTAGRAAAAWASQALASRASLGGYPTALITAAVVPLAVLVVITVADPLSGACVAVTLLMLGVFGPAGAQRTQVAKVTGHCRRATLRLAFGSSLALDLIATMSVALVAAETGLRLADGHLSLRTTLLVVILAPEAYLPLRNLALQFHATAAAGRLGPVGQVEDGLDQGVVGWDRNLRPGRQQPEIAPGDLPPATVLAQPVAVQHLSPVDLAGIFLHSPPNPPVADTPDPLGVLSDDVVGHLVQSPRAGVVERDEVLEPGVHAVE
jgi:hypothetical protein